jgi:hypothetical protein
MKSFFLNRCPLAAAAALWTGASLASDAGTAASDAFATLAAPAFASLPMYFEPNQGQSGSEARFLARGRGYTFGVMPWGARLALTRTQPVSANPRLAGAARPASTQETRVIEMRFVAAQPAPRMAGGGELPGRVNYFLGNDAAQWRTGVPLYQSVRLESVYPGVDVVFYGAHQQLEYDFVFAPQTDTAQAVVEFSGVDDLSIDGSGELILKVGGEEIRQHRPVLHQTILGKRRPVTGGYRQLGPRRVGFTVGEYDREHALIIDPVVNYATYFGGGGVDVGWQIVIDGTGAAYIAGETTSAELGATTGAFQTNYAGGTTNGGDAFVAKLNPEATGLEFLTYIGGRGNDGALAFALDATGNAYLTGYTDSTNYPTVNALNPKIGGKVDKVTRFPPADAFVTKLNTNGSQVLYSTYLGGESSDQGLGIAVDTNGNAVVVGYCDSTDFPTANPIQPAHGGTRDGFVTAFNAAGSAYLFSTFLGGTNTDLVVGVTLDPAGATLVCGYTFSTNFPVTNALQGQLGMSTNDLGLADAFLARLGGGGTQLVYSTYLGGEGSDYSYRVTADAAGNALLAGWGDSAAFPPTNTTVFLVATDGTNNTTTGLDVFVSKVSPDGALLNAVKFGGTGDDAAVDIELDPIGNVYVTGFTTSPQVPVVGASNAANQTNSGLNDAFIFALNEDFSALRYSLMFGGKVDDFGFGLDVDAAGNAYVVGRTASFDFPAVDGMQPAFAGGLCDAFVARVLQEPMLTTRFSGSNVILSWPAPAPGFKAQTRSDPASGAWLDLLPTPVLSNGVYTVTVPLAGEPAYFRLFRP